jgi:hypothetical protein
MITSADALTKEGLAKVLTRLNDDVAPSPADVAFVLSKADIIGDGLIHKPELVQVLKVWLGHVSCKEPPSDCTLERRPCR